MGRASGRLARHGSFGHLYLRTIMMILASVATTLSVILLLFSLPSCLHPILGRGRRSRHLLPLFVRQQPRHRLAQWLLHVNEYVSHHARTIVFTVVGRLIRIPCIRPVLPPQPATPLTVAAASRPTLVDASTGRVGHAPGLSPCVPSRRTWWRLSRLGYLSDEESRSKILDN
jgi:hypothetical protein